MILVLIPYSGCSTPEQEGFAIYLTRDDIPPEQMESLSYVDLADKPILQSKDIISYNAHTHEMKLSLKRSHYLSVNLPRGVALSFT